MISTRIVVTSAKRLKKMAVGQRCRTTRSQSPRPRAARGGRTSRQHRGEADDAADRERAFVDLLGERFDHQDQQAERDDSDFE